MVDACSNADSGGPSSIIRGKPKRGGRLAEAAGGCGCHEHPQVTQAQLAVAIRISVLVDNRPGQGGSVAMAALAKAPADGYTLMLSATASALTNPHLYKSVGYDTLKDFAPIGVIAEFPMLLVANPGAPFSNVREFVAHESGLESFAVVPWLGLFAPRGTPVASTERIDAEVRRIVQDPAAEKSLRSLGGVPRSTDPDEFARQLAREAPEWARIVRESGATVD